MTALAQRGLGSVYGTSRSVPFDRWFRYPAGFSADALDAAVSAANLAPKSRVIDPFCGAATVARALVPSQQFVGIEAHPLIADLGRLKLAVPPAPIDEFRRAANTIVDQAGPGNGAAEHELVIRCFDPIVLNQLVALRDALPQRSPWRAHLVWALLGTLRDVASVSVGWPYQRPGRARAAPYRDPAARFLSRVDRMSADLRAQRPSGLGRVVRGDSRKADAWRRAKRSEMFDGCITSPPYLNNFDYADATRLELFFSKRVSSWSEMCSHARADMVVATTQQSRRGLARSSAQFLSRRVPKTSERLLGLTTRLETERALRTRGKEYDQVLPAYFAGITKVLAHLRDSLTPRGMCAFVVGDSAPYGVPIDTPALIGQLAEELGFELIDDQLLRTRGTRWRTNGQRHQIALSERLVSFRR